MGDRIKRNVGVELYRCLLMLLICVYHANVHSAHSVETWLGHLLSMGVVGFAFISGWYGVSFSLVRIARLYGLGIFGAIVSALCCCEGGQWVKIALDNFRSYWFLHAYVIMMSFAPCIEIALETADRLTAVKRLSPILVMTFVWPFAGEVRYLRDFVPISKGLTQLSGYTLIGIYAAARLARLYEKELQHIRHWPIVSLCFGVVVCAGHFGFYQSPFAFCLALTWFMIFKRMTLPSGISRCVLVLAPSMFSVYLLHTNKLGLKMLSECDNMIHEVCGLNGLSIMAAGCVIYLGCIGVDMLRRGCVACVRILFLRARTFAMN